MQKQLDEGDKEDMAWTGGCFSWLTWLYWLVCWFGLVCLICWLVGMPGERRGERQGACWLGLEVGFADGARSATRLPATLVMERQS